MNEPISVGFTILERSKLFMGQLWYDELMPKLGGEDKMQCLYSDTDSFVVLGKGMTKPQALNKICDLMDFSNYPKHHSLYSVKNKAVPGFLKDENEGGHIVEFVGVKAKCYAIRTANNHLSKRCKGVQKNVVRGFDMDVYRRCFQEIHQMKAKQRKIQMKNYRVSLIESKKIAMSSFDDKSPIYPCAIHSCAYGCYHIKESSMCPICGIDVQCLPDL